MSESSASMRCDDCGLTRQLPDTQDGTELLVELHRFLQEHAGCSYAVSLNLTPGDPTG